MITFDKLIIVSGNRYSIRTDDIPDLSTLFNNIFDVNTMAILVLKYGTETHTINLGKLLTSHISFLESSTIHVLIGKLTPEMIYSYRTDMFSQNRVIRSYMNNDLPGRVTISPYNITSGEMTDMTYDPGYQDVIVTCSKYDLSKTFPIINHKLRYCTWSAHNILLKGRVDLVRATSEITFLSFGDTDFTVKSLKDISTDNWNVLPNTVSILVLGGSMFYDVSYMYFIDKTSSSIPKLRLNQNFIMGEFSKRGFTSFDDIINDLDSFVIMVETDRILVRDALMSSANMDQKINRFVCYEEHVHDHHVDYVCLDNKDYTVHGITVADELYWNVYTKERPKEHHVYTNGGSGDMRLIQMAIC